MSGSIGGGTLYVRGGRGAEQANRSAVYGAAIKLRDAVPGVMDITFNSSEINKVSYFHLITIKYP